MATKYDNQLRDTLARDLALAEARFHGLAYALDQAVIIVDQSNGICFSNPAADRLLEVPLGGLSGVRFVLPLFECMSGRHSLPLESGRILDVQMEIMACSLEGKPALMAIITPAVERDSHQSEAFEALRTRFLAHLSHELHTPLNTVMAGAEALSMELFGPLGQGDVRLKNHQAVRDIHQAGKRLLALITNLLDLSRAESSDLRVTDTLVSLQDLVDKALATLAEPSRIQLNITSTLMLRVDADKIVHALSHLLANSIACTPPPGDITLTANLQTDGRLMLRVSDSGDGLSETLLRRAFEPFPGPLGEDRATANVGAGTGLALVRHLIEAHGGSIRIDKRPMQGTHVTCMLPANRVTLVLNTPSVRSG